ncbi:unnamed protein product, partial [Rotaria sp. Silwood2]
STSGLDVTEAFKNSELEDELDSDSTYDFDNESDSEDEEQDTEGSAEERRWRIEWFEPKKNYIGFK